MFTDRDCDNCVCSTRSGDCRAWECNGTVTVADVKLKAKKKELEKIKKELREKIHLLSCYARPVGWIKSENIILVKDLLEIIEELEV